MNKVLNKQSILNELVRVQDDSHVSVSEVHLAAGVHSIFTYFMFEFNSLYLEYQSNNKK